MIMFKALCVSNALWKLDVPVQAGNIGGALLLKNVKCTEKNISVCVVCAGARYPLLLCRLPHTPPLSQSC